MASDFTRPRINREGLDHETTRRLGLSILAFINISRERGRSEQFLSGLEVAYELVTGSEARSAAVAHDERQEPLF
jgi:hypothetical protein